ncbi:hypothetical protein [Microcoleus vaginatus]|uniref:hypothetical protein n=1 Tax=Microcoleus vaginatus TaxID=119532 RepID=UPI0032A64115
MSVIETSIDKAWGFSTYFFHTLIKQCPVSIEQLLQNADLSPSELFNELQSLGRRSLIEIEEQENEMLFSVCPVVRQDVLSNPVG